MDTNWPKWTQVDTNLKKWTQLGMNWKTSKGALKSATPSKSTLPHIASTNLEISLSLAKQGEEIAHGCVSCCKKILRKITNQITISPLSYVLLTTESQVCER